MLGGCDSTLEPEPVAYGTNTDAQARTNTYPWLAKASVIHVPHRKHVVIALAGFKSMHQPADLLAVQ